MNSKLSHKTGEKCIELQIHTNTMKYFHSIQVGTRPQPMANGQEPKPVPAESMETPAPAEVV